MNGRQNTDANMGETCAGQRAPVVWHEHERFMSQWDPTEPVFDEDDMFLPPVVVSVLTAVLGDLGLRPSMVTAAATTGLAATSPRLGDGLGKGLWEQSKQPYDVDFKESSPKKTQQSEAQRIDWKTYYTNLEVVSVDAYQSQPGSGYEADDEMTDSGSDRETESESESEDWESDSGLDCETRSESTERESDSDWSSSSKWVWDCQLYSDSDCEPKSESESWPESQSDQRETFGLKAGTHLGADSKSSRSE